jgi:3',5'-cyclic AMP phosphodiesterase CpdA
VTRFRLAHLSDPHLGPVPRPSLLPLVSKRAFGYANWLRARRRALAGGILERIVEDVARQSPDHIAVTGDLVNIALPGEFTAAADWLASLGPPSRVTVVPGNHDAYVPGAARRAATAWDPFMTGDGGSGLPFLRRRGPVALIGVSTAVATPPGFATGRVGATQRAALAGLLDRCDDAVKVVLMHHPPDPMLSPGRRRLVDHAAVREILAAGCVDLVLHGHNHRSSLAWIETPHGPAPMIGVPSASSDGTHHPPAGYALLDIDTADASIRLTRRGLQSATSRVATLETVTVRRLSQAR